MHRIVYNEQTSTYRIEKRGLFGWNFVIDQATSDYLRFDDIDAACRWIDANTVESASVSRRWKVVNECKA